MTRHSLPFRKDEWDFIKVSQNLQIHVFEVSEQNKYLHDNQLLHCN